jgi:ABC-type transport system involved in multi-copper enzyme maturation permease subunit
MPLTLHLLKKDLRRSQLLLTCWLLLVAVQFAIMASSLHPEDRLASLTYSAISGFGPSLGAIVFGVLVALLVQEEPPAGTTGFWLTRPMSRSAVLRAKVVFGAILLAVPVMAEVIVLAAAGVTGHDLALAVPEMILDELQIFLAAAVLAALTPNFARFAIAAAVVWVGLYLANLGVNWLSSYVSRDSTAGGMNFTTLLKSRKIAHAILISVGFGTAFAYQYLTRRTARALAIAVFTELGAIAIDFAWPLDFFPPRPAPPTTVKLDSAAIHTTLQDTHVQDLLPDQSSSQQLKNVGGNLVVKGLPEGYVALPRSVLPRLTGSDGRTVPARPPRQTNYFFVPFPRMFESAFGQVFVYGQRFYSETVPTGLVLLKADDFRKYAGQRLTFSSDFGFELEHYIIRARMPLAKGSRANLGSEHEIITDVLRDGDLVDVIFHRRYVDLLFAGPSDYFQPDRYLSAFNFSLGNSTYVLLNRNKREVILTQMNGVSRLSEPLSGSRLAQETWQISFGPSDMALTPNLNDAWLAGAELVELELKPAAEFTQSLKLRGFILDGPNTSHLPLPPVPPSDPQWLTRFTLPAQATKVQMREYVDEIVAASQYWHADSRKELPVAMLAKVGPGNADVLLGAIDKARPRSDEVYILQLATLRSAGPEDKVSVLRALAANPALVDLVVKFKWQADCRDTLVAALRDEQKNNLPRGWIAAMAALQDPATYTDLKAYLIRTRSRQSTYNAIRKLPGFDLRDAVAAAWKQALSGPHSGLVDAAAMAVDLGYPDALETLINVLRDDDVSEPEQITKALTLAKHYTPATGEAVDVVAWYDSNKDRLVFDAARRKFLLVAAH